MNSDVDSRCAVEEPGTAQKQRQSTGINWQSLHFEGSDKLIKDTLTANDPRISLSAKLNLKPRESVSFKINERKSRRGWALLLYWDLTRGGKFVQEKILEQKKKTSKTSVGTCEICSVLRFLQLEFNVEKEKIWGSYTKFRVFFLRKVKNWFTFVRVSLKEIQKN